MSIINRRKTDAFAEMHNPVVREIAKNIYIVTEMLSQANRRLGSGSWTPFQVLNCAHWVHFHVHYFILNPINSIYEMPTRCDVEDLEIIEQETRSFLVAHGQLEKRLVENFGQEPSALFNDAYSMMVDLLDSTRGQLASHD